MKNKGLKAIASGLAGALTLTLVHQTLKLFVKDAPKVDLLGMRGIEKFLQNLNLKIPDSTSLYRLSLAGDLLFNTFYYSLTATGKRPLLSGSLLGLSAGAGVVTLPEPMNLGSDLSAKNLKQKALAFGIYLSGGLSSAGVYKLFERYSK